MIILDTNVLSEMLKSQYSPAVANWVRGQSPSVFFTTAITEAEILLGIAILPPGKKRIILAAQVREIFVELFAERVLPFDSQASHAFAEISSLRRAKGHPMSYADTQIAAIARTHGAAIATRNVRDFDECGVEIINPWLSA